MFGKGFGQNPAVEKAKKEAVSNLKEATLQMLPPEERWDEIPGGKAPEGQETNVIINQLACMEEGCPDVELVITLVRPKPRPKLMFKIYKAAVDLSPEELEVALQQAMAWEASKPESQPAAAGVKHSTEIYIYKPEGADAQHSGSCCDSKEHD